jgi:hypothetical protein
MLCADSVSVSSKAENKATLLFIEQSSERLLAAIMAPKLHISSDMTKRQGRKKTGCHRDIRFPKTNYLKTNLLKQIKNIFIYGAKLSSIPLLCKLLQENRTLF